VKTLFAATVATILMATAANADGLSFKSGTSVGVPGASFGHATGIGLDTNGKTINGNFGSVTQISVPGAKVDHGTELGGTMRIPGR